MGRISPASHHHINFKGIFQFPLARYRSKLLVEAGPIAKATASRD
jgi:hypothetical protein